MCGHVWACVGVCALVCMHVCACVYEHVVCAHVFCVCVACVCVICVRVACGYVSVCACMFVCFFVFISVQIKISNI